MDFSDSWLRMFEFWVIKPVWPMFLVTGVSLIGGKQPLLVLLWMKAWYLIGTKPLPEPMMPKVYSTISSMDLINS